MEYFIYNGELYHHGIKGMKWGIRRYQNKDGSLTKAGLKRRAKLEAELTKLGGGKKSSSKSESDKPKETLEERKARVRNSNNAETIYKNKDIFSDKEIGDIYNRLNNEKNIKGLIPERISKGKRFINQYVETAKTVKNVVDATDNVLTSMDKVKKILDRLSGDDKRRGDN